MSFNAAFHYPYKNLPKIATIVLGFTIVIAAFVAMAINSQTPDGFLALTGATILAQSLFLTGYGVRVIRHLMDENDESMPSIKLFSDIGRGIVVTVAGFLLYLPLLAVVYFSGIVIAIQTVYGRSLEPSGIFLIVVCFALFLYLTSGLMVGMIRHAREERASTLFQYFTNLKYVKQNKKATLKLLLFAFIVGIIYMVTTNATSFLYELTVIESLSFRSSELEIVAVITVSIILSIGFSLLQQFANLHLMAQFAEEIGLNRHSDAYEKMKN